MITIFIISTAKIQKIFEICKRFSRNLLLIIANKIARANLSVGSGLALLRKQILFFSP